LKTQFSISFHLQQKKFFIKSSTEQFLGASLSRCLFFESKKISFKPLKLNVLAEEKKQKIRRKNRSFWRRASESYFLALFGKKTIWSVCL
jgi:RAB protein geranylgeranyltransferase component A